MRICTLVLVLCAVFLWLSTPGPAEAWPTRGLTTLSQEETTAAPAETEAQEPEPEEIRSGPKDIQERIAAYVFLGWLWLSILVLIYVLRLKIKESDRLNSIAYFDTDKETPRQGT